MDGAAVRSAIRPGIHDSKSLLRYWHHWAVRLNTYRTILESNRCGGSDEPVKNVVVSNKSAVQLRSARVPVTTIINETRKIVPGRLFRSEERTLGTRGVVVPVYDCEEL